jgi:peptidoglycan/LPS O-acetylase OafA/YrhL
MRVTRLDGLRGLAIAMVMGYHEFHFQLGWVGVDLFFVLSGYLVTQILRRDRDDEVFWRPFYIKRATRILPIFFVALLVCALFYREEWHKLRFYYLFFAANFGLVPYEGSMAFGALWSLSVEEHFYFAWPPAIRTLGRHRLMQILIGILILEPILRGIVGSHVQSYWITYALTPFRLDSIAAGSLLALALEEAEPHLAVWAKYIGLVSLVLIAGLSVTHHFDHKSNSLFFNVVGYSLVSLCAASFVAWVVLSKDSWISKVLESRPLTFLGTISYGLYLFHPIIFFQFHLLALRWGLKHQSLLLPIVLPGTLFACWVSFAFFEKRMIRLGHMWANRVKERVEIPA